VGRSAHSLAQAIALNMIDSAESNIEAALKNADMVLIAAPVAQTASILNSLQPFLAPNTVVTDAGSTKSDVLAAAKLALGEKFNQFVGGHPIAGAEKSGPAAAMSDLFIQKNVVLTPTIETRPEALQAVTQLWQTCGANVASMPAEQHDSIFAAVSHLPHLLAFALVDDIASRPNAAQLFSFAASGFRDFTRIAGSHPEMWRDISLANKQALLNELNAYQQELSIVKQLLENDDAVGLEALFERASGARNQWANGKK
ncbi:MAG TPA: prephenate dehydrogenase/arogenate dehydrogenase family protein, partial [Methylophilus sp.]